MTTLQRGTPVIIDEIDAPDGRTVAILMKKSKSGYWKARYLSTFPSMIYCSGYNPIPIADFGVELDWLDNNTYRVIKNGKPLIAIYSDGETRAWSEPYPVYHKSRPMATSLVRSHDN